jgi:hypothetical protein
MQTRCRKSLIWIGALLMVALVSSAGARSAGAKAMDPPDLSWLQDDSCAEGIVLASLETPDWLAAEPQAPDAAKPAGKECTVNKQCKTKQYCAKGVGDCKGKGQCTAKPEVCPLDYKPVCGCNKKTYSNACFAALAGVNVASEGACKEAKVCKTNKQCPAGDFCAKELGKCEDEGVCAQRPKICPFIVAPVCGCNNKTYNNGCLAHEAGVSVKHDGKCEK